MEKQELQTSFLRKYFKSSTKLSQLPIEEQVALFREAISQNATLTKILSQALDLDLPEWYLASGCIFQTVWNVLTGRDPEAGIADYDLVYYDKSDISWAAEDAAIQKGQKIFTGDNNNNNNSSSTSTTTTTTTTPVEIRNQARVHLWYKENRGIDCPQHASAEAAIATFPTTTASLGVRLLPNGDWRIFAPHGFADLFDLIVRPNPVLTPPHVYKAKSERWQRQWPGLTVLPWPEAEVESSGQEEAGVGLASGVYIAPRLAP
ncbi:hypothetical protein CBS147322_2181 [Aspergillus niger]|nr:hypothetical protein CBS147322_2181 [Aspergillus niger]